MTRNGGQRDPAGRQQALAEHVMREGTAVAQELADQFGVSLVTVHRDLDQLVRRGIVRKYRGGVTAQPSSVFESNVAFRSSTAVAQKQAMARAARVLVEPGMSVLLDDSTSTLALAEALHDVAPLTVVTNFLPTVRALTAREDVTLICLGGVYNAVHDSFVGASCTEAARALRTDIGFYSFAGVDDGGVYHQEQEVVATKRGLLDVAHRRVLVVDHSKLGRTALHRVAGLETFSEVVTDDGAPAEVLAALRERLPVVVAPVTGA